MPKRMRQNEVQQQRQQQPKEMTINVRGQKRDYHYVETVNSMEELETFRFKNFCMFNGTISIKRIRDVAKSFIMPCTRKKMGRGCDFELRAVRPDLASSIIHIYAHSEHNHPLMPEERRAMSKHEKELMPAENPPTILRTPDKMKWQFLQTVADYEKMQQFRSKNGCLPTKSVNNERRRRIRFPCACRQSSHCQFMLTALKTTTNGFHVYKYGRHKHKNRHSATFREKQRQRNANQQVMADDIDDEKEDEESEKEDDDHGEEQQPQQVQRHPNEVPKQRKPPMDITRIVKGQIRKYHFVKTVKSVEELDKFRFKNHCHFSRGKPLKVLGSYIMPCTRKLIFGIPCNFQLMAFPSTDSQSGDIHVYRHSQHSNHPFLSDDRRARIRKGKELMPAQNPPAIFRTPDNLKWQFLQTFADYEQMQNFLPKKLGQSRSVNRIRSRCQRRWTHNCPFMLLALKTIEDGYHVYQHGEHKHNNYTDTLKPKKRQQPARGRQKQEKILETKEEEEEEEEEDVSEESESESESEDDDDDDDDDNDDDYEEEEDDDYEEEDNSMAMDQRKRKVNEDQDEDEDDFDKGVEQNEAEREEVVEAIEEEKESEEQEGEEVVEEGNDQQIILGEDEIQQQQEEEQGGSMDIEIIENPAEETLEQKLAKATRKVHKWMAGIGPNEIDATIGEWDKKSLLKIVEMADMEIREHPQKLNLWLPWLKCAIPKCLPQIEGFNVRFNDLINLTGA